MKDKKLLTLTTLAGFAIATSAQAALLVYEPFDYSTGALAGNSGATGLSGNWSSSGSNQQSVVSPGLSFTGLSTTGNAARRTSAPGGAESNVSLTSSAVTSLTADNSTIYFSLLVRNDRFSVANENLAFVFGSGPLVVPSSDKQNPTISGGEGFGIHLDGNTDGGSTIDIFGYQIDDGVASQSSGKIDNGTSVDTFMLVGQIDWVANGNNDTLSLWNVADPTVGLGSSFAAMTADLDQSLFDTLAVESQQVGTIDEIRFGTTLSDVGVIPEPSTALLGGLGLLFLLRRRR